MQIFAFDTVPSTMFVAKDIAHYSKDNIFCVLAQSQENGLGTQGRQWHSPIGNFYATFCFKDYTQELLLKIAIITGLSIAESLKDYKIDVTLKWINDIIIKGKKVGGILCDFLNNHLYIGIGLNFKVNPITEDSKLLDNKNFSLLQSDKINEHLNIDYNKFASNLGDVLLKNFDILKNGDFKYFIDLWHKYAAFYNQYLTVELPDGTLKKGINKGINDKGYLSLKTDNGIEYFYSARITGIA